MLRMPALDWRPCGAGALSFVGSHLPKALLRPISTIESCAGRHLARRLRDDFSHMERNPAILRSLGDVIRPVSAELALLFNLSRFSTASAR